MNPALHQSDISGSLNLWINSNGEVVHPGAPSGGGGPGRFASTGPLGLSDGSPDLMPHPLAPAFRRYSSILNGDLAVLADRRPAQRGYAQYPRALSASGQSTDLNLFGIFISDWDGRPDVDILEAADLMRQNRSKETWFPGSKELKTFASSLGIVPFPVNSTEQVLSAIVKHKPARLNLFTHGTPFGFIMLEGQISGGDVDGSMFDTDAFCGPEIMRLKDNISLDEVRNSFQQNAEIYIYACYGGVKQEILDGIRDALGVSVFSFKKSILYFPKPDRPRPPNGTHWPHQTKIAGWRWGYADPNREFSNYTQLLPDASALSKTGPVHKRCEVKDWL